MELQPFSDLKVLELGQLIAGPYCGKLFADLGAEVIKVEEPGVGDESRRTEPFLHDEAHPERSGLFLYLNTNKLGVTLNLNSKTGKEIFRKLVKETDILVENNPPALMQEWRLSYESLKEINPSLIMTSVTPFGQSGPYRDYKTTELVSFNMGGLGFATPGMVDNPDEEPPLKGGGHMADFTAATTAAVATLCAVFARKGSGLGEHIDVSEQEAVASFYRVPMTEYLYTQQTRGRALSAFPGRSWAGMLPCQDGYVNLAPFQDAHWNGLIGLMGNPEWAQEERFKDAQSRRQYAQEIRTHIEEWTKTQDKDELAEAAQQLGFPGSPIYAVDEAINLDQLAAREFFAEIDRPETGVMRYPGSPFKMSEGSWRLARPAPLLGQHNEEVYCGRLGYTKQVLVKLRETGVI